jgi:2-dehydro-3-deoxyphosphogluconate aldolase/(4S)-4-hydroxy-2-oxoglutarate aldolase
VQDRISFIARHRLFGVIRADSMEQALMAARAAHRGGLRLIEVTFSVPDAPQAISLLREELPGSMVGAGTVLRVEQARAAAEAGAEFIVAPDTNPEVVRFCKDRGVLACPGAATPTEIMTALRLGADLVKVFPAGLLGGPAYLRALREPLAGVRLVATGGVNAENAAEYLAAGAFAVGMGGEIFPRAALAAGDVDAVERAARECVAAVAT